MEKESRNKKAMKENKPAVKHAAKETDVRNAGFGIAAPSSSCNDVKCPFHGNLKVKGRTFTGIVVKSLAQKTATVEWERKHYIPKYERYERRWTKLHVHNPPCINAEDGDIVVIMECRPLSKTKHFVIVQRAGKKELKRPEEDIVQKEEKKDIKDAKQMKEKQKEKSKEGEA